MLLEHPQWCKWQVLFHGETPPSKFARKDDQHEHGSVKCVLAGVNLLPCPANSMRNRQMSCFQVVWSVQLAARSGDTA
jgi:hypothetical protein